jgi:hypothetical protein
MASIDHDDPTAAVPEADRLEQAEPADPRLADEESPAPPTAAESDEADLLEQAQPVDEDADEEYPPDLE